MKQKKEKNNNNKTNKKNNKRNNNINLINNIIENNDIKDINENENESEIKIKKNILQLIELIEKVLDCKLIFDVKEELNISELITQTTYYYRLVVNNKEDEILENQNENLYLILLDNFEPDVEIKPENVNVKNYTLNTYRFGFIYKQTPLNLYWFTDNKKDIYYTNIININKSNFISALKLFKEELDIGKIKIMTINF